MKTLTLAALAGIGLFALTDASFAACTYSRNYEAEGGMSGWPARVANSADATLRAAYANGTCVYLKGQHNGGMAPAGTPSNQHVTVSNGVRVCHVFKKSSTNRNQYFPTTCL
ncbi:hypothetical protein [Pannonibacter phragmitetus]|uniref:hypothetical protein n=1 Tax=Pannonibacter phragmitetus TaxID=121719 RepID=UPI000F45162A|nr:hypothetical protein [Pannonibacter phragmitetus]MBA4205775.1 hypothetical protein [Polymorphum sp.]